MKKNKSTEDFEKNCYFRYARDLLSDLAEQFPDHLSLCEAQNEIVSTGLRFHDEHPELYTHGALVTVRELLEVNREDLANWLNHNPDEGVKDWLSYVNKIMALYDHLRELMYQDADHDKVRVLLIGDSISASWGIPDPKKRWVQRMVDIMKDHGLEVEVANCSIPGAQTDQGVHSIEASLEAFRPDVVLGTQAGNDVHVGKSVYKIEKNIVYMVNACLEYMKKKFPDRNPTEFVQWGGGIPETFKNAGPMGKASFFDMFEKISNETGIKTLLLPEEILSKKNIQEDRIHFVEEVQEHIANIAFKTLESPVRSVLQYKQEKLKNPFGVPLSSAPVTFLFKKEACVRNSFSSFFSDSKQGIDDMEYRQKNVYGV